ncbi:MAG: CPBP family intramembrane metalloprotease [Armatimonadetes bacterium]|nr:CPBP family intramembrane metalloprotease [Armatimonadota bacterium]
MLPSSPLQNRPLRALARPDLLRLALVVGFVAAIFGVVHGLSGARRWYVPTASVPLQGDVLYRAGMLLKSVPLGTLRKLALDPEDILHSGIGAYERLALREDSPNASAMYRLAIIYSKRGFPEHGSSLFDRLVTLDGQNADLYFAVSSVYETRAVGRGELLKARDVIAPRRDWITRLALVDCLRRAGDDKAAQEVMQEIDRRTRSFAWILGAVALTYVAVLVAGVGFLAVVAYRKLFTIQPEHELPTPQVYWTVLEAVEATAVLIAGMVLAGLLSGILLEKLDLDNRATWAVPVAAILTYLLFAAPALILIFRRTARHTIRPLRALGFRGRFQLTLATTGLRAYCMFVAGAALAALAARWLGVSPLAARSPIELLQSARGLPDIVAYFILICVLAPLVEETIFRGYVYAGLRTRFATPAAAVLSAGMFALAHLNMAPSGMAAVALVGVLLAYLYENTRSLWPGVIVHAFHNMLAFLLILGAGI